MDVYKTIQAQVQDGTGLVARLEVVKAVTDAAWSHFDRKIGYVDNITREMYEDSWVFESWQSDALGRLARAVADAGLIPIELPVITKIYYNTDMSGVLDTFNPISQADVDQGRPWRMVEIRYRVRCRMPVTS